MGRISRHINGRRGIWPPMLVTRLPYFSYAFYGAPPGERRLEERKRPR